MITQPQLKQQLALDCNKIISKTDKQNIKQLTDKEAFASLFYYNFFQNKKSFINL